MTSTFTPRFAASTSCLSNASSGTKYGVAMRICFLAASRAAENVTIPAGIALPGEERATCTADGPLPGPGGTAGSKEYLPLVAHQLSENTPAIHWTAGPSIL